MEEIQTCGEWILRHEQHLLDLEQRILKHTCKEEILEAKQAIKDLRANDA